MQLAESFKIDAPVKTMEHELIQVAHRHISDRKILYTLLMRHI